MVIFHSIIALGAGLGVTLAILGMTGLLVRRATPDWAGTSSAGSAFVSLGSAFLAGAAGGFVTAWASAVNPLGHVLGLALGLTALAALIALMSRGRQPLWQQIAVVGLTPLGVMAGGLMRLRLWGYF